MAGCEPLDDGYGLLRFSECLFIVAFPGINRLESVVTNFILSLPLLIEMSFLSLVGMHLTLLTRFS